MYLNVLIDGQQSTLSKQKLCWLMQSESVRVSSDITRRFIPNRSIISSSLMREGKNIFEELQSITRGDFVVIFHDNFLFAGTVLNFQKSRENSKSKRNVLNDVLDLTKDEEVHFSLDPLFKVDSQNFKPSQFDKFIYFQQNSYKYMSSVKWDR